MNPIILSVAELKPALLGLGKVIPKRSSLQVLCCVRMQRTEPGCVYLAVTDLDTAAIVRLDTPGPSAFDPLELLIRYEDLSNIVKKCETEDSIHLAPLNETQVSVNFPVAGQWVERRFECSPFPEFPYIPSLPGEGILLDNNLRESLHAALECASTDPTRLVLNGACLDVGKSEAHYVVGTDGRHLFSSNSFTLPLKGSLIIPNHRFLQWKGFNSDGDWWLRAPDLKNAQHVSSFEIASDHWRLIARAYEGNYPNWQHVVPELSSFATRVDIGTEQLPAAMDTIQRIPCHCDKYHTVGLEVTDGKLQILGRSTREMPWTMVPVETQKVEGPDVMIFVDRELLLKGLRFGLGSIHIIDSISPLRLSDEGRQMIMMPLRPQGAPSVTPSPRTPADPTPAVEAATPTSPPLADSTQTRNSAMPTYEDHSSSSVIAETPSSKSVTDAGKSNNGSATALAEKSALETALAQIDSIKAEFREAIGGLGKLADLLKQAVREQKTSDKEIQSVRLTLRSLQSVRI